MPFENDFVIPTTRTVKCFLCGRPVAIKDRRALKAFLGDLYMLMHGDCGRRADTLTIEVKLRAAIEGSWKVA